MSFKFSEGVIPLLVSFPHDGSRIPEAISQTMTSAGKSSRDTDWFLSRLYDFFELADASLLVATRSRYVIDLNRPTSNESLYPGQSTTGLVPLTRFDGEPIYLKEPSREEVQRRIKEVWLPYHQKIESELTRMTEQFGVAVLIEAHSIETEVPRLFEGRLPDFNIGTNCGKSCDTEVSDAVMSVLQNQSQYSHVLNGRFVGGHITRHFGDPSLNRHAIQFELAQSTYLDEVGKIWDQARADQVQPVFRKIIAGIKQWLKSKQT